MRQALAYLLVAGALYSFAVVGAIELAQRAAEVAPTPTLIPPPYHLHCP